MNAENQKCQCQACWSGGLAQNSSDRLCFVCPLLTACFKQKADCPTSPAQPFTVGFAPAVAHQSFFIVSD